jgi:hypothetical protein
MPFGLHWHAGNLLFVGDLGHNFRALDQENGKVLWDIRILSVYIGTQAICCSSATSVTTSVRSIRKTVRCCGTSGSIFR